MVEVKSKEETYSLNEEKLKYYEKKMENLECPFTWKMGKVNYSKTNFNPQGDSQYFPLIRLMCTIVQVHEDVKNNQDAKTILEKLKDCDDIMTELIERAHPEISQEMILFVLNATKGFIYLRLQMEPELKELLAQTASVDLSNKKQMSTLNACKNIAWSNNWLCETSRAKAIEFIREAIEDNPNCDLWHFILGKALRRERRRKQFNAKPDPEEFQRFEKAYEIFRNPVYGVFLAQVYRELKNKRKSLEIYDRVLQDNPQSETVLLRMALGYVNWKEFKKAKICLQKAAEKCPERSMYLHYLGLYHLRQGQYLEASQFLEDAIKDDNLAAEHDYMRAMQRKDKYFDVTQHLLKMLDKYKSYPKDKVQSLILQLGYTYFKRDGNLEQSLEYFLEAVEMNPDAKCLKNFFSDLICNNKEKNVFVILNRDILPMVYGQPNRFDAETNERASRLQEYCDNKNNNE